jgi:hypothetical protein
VAATGLVFAFTWFFFSGQGFDATGRPQHSLLCRGHKGRRFTFRAARPGKIAPGVNFPNLGDSRGRSRSPGPCAVANRAHTRAFRSIL